MYVQRNEMFGVWTVSFAANPKPWIYTKNFSNTVSLVLPVERNQLRRCHESRCPDYRQVGRQEGTGSVQQQGDTPKAGASGRRAQACCPVGHHWISARGPQSLEDHRRLSGEQPALDLNLFPNCIIIQAHPHGIGSDIEIYLDPLDSVCPSTMHPIRKTHTHVSYFYVC